MATGAQLDLLAAIHERSPEGVGVPEDELRPEGGDTFDEDLAALEEEGLLEVVARDSGGPDTVAVTDEGRLALQPRSSL
jgi:hypothetical protein